MLKKVVINKAMWQILLLLLFSSLFFLFYFLELHQYLTFEAIKDQQVKFTSYYQKNMLVAVLIFAILYIVFTTLSIPFANLMSLLGGAMFGLALGTAVIAVSSTIGATLAFLLSRFLFRSWIHSKLADRSASINKHIRQHGAGYLLALRLMPVFPFFLINLLMGLTGISVFKFVIFSFVGMLPGIFTYVLAGNQLAKIESPGDIFSPLLIASFTLIGLVPLLSKHGLKLFSKIFRQKSNTPIKPPFTEK